MYIKGGGKEGGRDKERVGTRGRGQGKGGGETREGGGTRNGGGRRKGGRAHVTMRGWWSGARSLWFVDRGGGRPWLVVGCWSPSVDRGCGGCSWVMVGARGWWWGAGRRLSIVVGARRRLLLVLVRAHGSWTLFVGGGGGRGSMVAIVAEGGGGRSFVGGWHGRACVRMGRGGATVWW